MVGPVILSPLLLIIATAPIGATICGAIAVSKIRHSGSRFYGLGLAMFDALVFPLLALDALVGFCLIRIIQISGLLMGTDLVFRSAVYSVAVVVVCLIVDILVIRRAWRAAKRPLAGTTTFVTPPPPTGPPKAYTIDRARQDVRIPAIGLILCAAINLLAIWVAVVRMANTAGLNWLGILGIAATLAVNLFIVFSAVGMMHLRRFGGAIAGSILAILAVPGSILGLPFGIWALMVLSRREVKDAFAASRYPAAGPPTTMPPAPTRRLFGPALNTAIFHTVLLAILVGLAMFALPKFKEMFWQMGAALPSLTQITLNFGDALQANGLLLVPAVGVLDFALCLWLQSVAPALRRTWSVFVSLALVAVTLAAGASVFFSVQALTQGLQPPRDGLEPPSASVPMLEDAQPRQTTQTAILNVTAPADLAAIKETALEDRAVELTLDDPRVKQTQWFKQDPSSAEKRLRMAMGIRATPNSSLLSVTFSAQDPSDAATIVNALADAIVDNQYQRVSRDLQFQIEKLTKQQEQIKQQIEVTQREIADLRDLRFPDMTKGSEQLGSELRRLEKEQDEAKGAYHDAAATRGAEDPQVDKAKKDLKRLEDQYASTKQEAQQLMQKRDAIDSLQARKQTFEGQVVSLEDRLLALRMKILDTRPVVLRRYADIPATPAPTPATTQPASGPGIETTVFNLKHTKADRTAAELRKRLNDPTASIEPGPTGNSIVVRASAETMHKVASILAELDRPVATPSPKEI